jgi:hypothetical protein
MLRKVIYLILLIYIILSCSSNIDYTPQTFLDYKQTNILNGDAAKTFVDRLHFQVVAKDSNVVAFYEGTKENSDAIIYLTYYSDLQNARDDYAKMTQKISPENSVFVEGKYIKINDKEVYRCFGMGQTHYVFYDQSVLFWLSLPTLDANRFMHAYIDYIHH